MEEEEEEDATSDMGFRCRRLASSFGSSGPPPRAGFMACRNVSGLRIRLMDDDGFE